MKSDLIALFKELKDKYPKELKGYTLGFDNAIRRLGSCNYRERLITISNKHLVATSKEILINTLKHEVAHAYSYYHHGFKGRGHNGFFYNACSVIGAEPKRCASVSEDKEEITPKYVGVCPSCKFTFKAFRKLKRLTSCGKCSPTFNRAFIINYVDFNDYKKLKEKGE
jgi:predicted SprT family Zn-dependent metalloprotease